MLSLLIVFAIVVPLMIWALSPATVRRRKSSQGSAPAADVVSMPAVAASSLPFESSCDAVNGSCDGGGS